MFVKDASRFVLSYRNMIETSPLQLYSSALLFSPQRSIIRKQFLEQVPPWIARKPVSQEDWGQCLQTLEGHTDYVWAAAFSPDGELLASSSVDKTVKLWNSNTGALFSTFEGHSGWVRGVAFSPDGQLLASASFDGTVRLWDPITGALRSTLVGHSGVVFAVAFRPDGRIIASSSADKTVKLWNSNTGAPPQNPRGSFRFGRESCIFGRWPASRFCIGRQHREALGSNRRNLAQHPRGSLRWGLRSGISARWSAPCLCV